MTIKEFKKLNQNEREEYGKTLPLESTYDKKGNKLTYRNSDGWWRELTHNENNKILTYKDNNGYWYERTYDENGKELTYKDDNGYWQEYTYDKNGNILTYKNNSGFWIKYTYDENGKELTFRNSKGFWRKKTYDEKGNMLSYRDSDKNIDRDIFEIKIPKYDINKVVDNIENAASPSDVIEEVKQVLRFERELEEEKIRFDEKINEKLTQYKEYKALVDKLKDNYKHIALDFLDTSEGWIITKKQQVNDETGEVTFVEKRTHTLPQGMRFTPPKAKITYDESKVLEDKYYNKTLKKKLVTEAIKKGELPSDIIKSIPNKTKGTISIEPSTFITKNLGMK